MIPAPTPAEPTRPAPPSAATEGPGFASDDERLSDLADDFFLRYRRGESPTVEEYAQQDPSLADRVRELFPGLLAMEQSATGPGIKVHPGTEQLGAMIGRYRLLERLGEGGFGVVFLAEQLTPVRRKVALKVIKPGLDTRQVIDRFEAERQALALMDHENIAKVLDAGATDAGRPYFVMELVDGLPITDYCEKHQLAPRHRLELFVRMCAAVQHAHTKGIIHRDLKPTNILVAVHDGLPVPKVIDFGVAKATAQQQLTDGTLFTSVAQIIGTPLYMSPEQAEMSGQDVDTRSDVYSLGAVLYELLTGTTPVDKARLKQAGFDQVRRIIREEEPPRPSTRISTLSGPLLTASAQRRGDLKKLGQLVRGELDWIVMKALEKDRMRRYETVRDFAADVERYLNDEAVHACPPSATYRMQKLLRRHKGPVAAACLVALALVGGIIGTTWGMARARAEARDKQTALTAALRSEGKARDKEFQALLSQAHAERVSGRAGQRFGALRTVAKAAQIRMTPELRNEAAAALALPDIELAQEWSDTDPNGQLTFSFDGPVINYARVSQQGAVTICRVTDDREEVVAGPLAAHGHSVISGPWWSHDRRFLAYGHSGNEDEGIGGLCVWKLDGPAPAVVLDEPAGVNLSAFAFHAGGRKCAFARAAGEVIVHDLESGRRQPLTGGKVVALAFHPSDDRLAVAYPDIAHVFDSNTGSELNALRPAELTQNIRCIAWHPQGRRVVMGVGGSIHLFDADSGAEIPAPWVNRRGEFERIDFTHAGDRLFTWDGSQQTVLWDVTTGRQLLATPQVLDKNSTLSGDDRFIGFSRAGEKIQVWRFESGRELRELDYPDDQTDALYGRAVDGTGRIYAAGSINGKRLSFFDTETGEELARIPVPAQAAYPFEFDPGGGGGWFTGGTRGVLLWPLRSEPGRPELLRVGPPQPLLPGPGNPSWINSRATTNGRVIAITDDSSVIVINRDRPGPPLTLGPQASTTGSAISPDGKWVAIGSGRFEGPPKSVPIWDGKDGRHVDDLPSAGGFAEFSPDNQWLATQDLKNASRLWKVGSWDKPERSFVAGRVIFSPDGQLMALNDVIGCIRLLKTASREEVACLMGPDPHVYWPMCFTPDGTKLIAMPLCVWDLRLIREQLSAMGLDWDHKDWPPFPPAVPDTRGRLRLTVDAGPSAQAGPASSPLPGPQRQAP